MLNWKKRKTLAAINNRKQHQTFIDFLRAPKQHQREFDPTRTSATEFTTENGLYLATETLFDANNNSLNYYIIAE